MAFLQHITAEGERWDALAYRYYGDPFAYERIIVANPSQPIEDVLPAGQVLMIPLIEAAEATSEDVPPWLR